MADEPAAIQRVRGEVAALHAGFVRCGLVVWTAGNGLTPQNMMELAVDVSNLGQVEVVDAQTLHDNDIHAKNTLDDPERVGLKPNTPHSICDGTRWITLPPVSWTTVTLR